MEKYSRLENISLDKADKDKKINQKIKIKDKIKCLVK